MNITNLDQVNEEIDKVKYRYNPEWRTFQLMIILIRLVAKILDRMEGEQ